MNMVSRLQEENRRIQKDQSPNSTGTDTHFTTPNSIKDDVSNNLNGSATDFQVLQRLRGQVDKYRNDLKIKDLELQAKTSDVENVIVNCI